MGKGIGNDLSREKLFPFNPKFKDFKKNIKLISHLFHLFENRQ